MSSRIHLSNIGEQVKTTFEEEMMAEAKEKQSWYDCIQLVNMLKNSLRYLIKFKNTTDSREIKNNKNTTDSREIKNNNNTTVSRKIKNNKNTTDSRKIKNNENTNIKSTKMQNNHKSPDNANSTGNMDHRLAVNDGKITAVQWSSRIQIWTKMDKQSRIHRKKYDNRGHQIKRLVHLACLCILTTGCTGTVYNDEVAMPGNLTLEWRMLMEERFDLMTFYKNKQLNMGTYTRQEKRIRETMLYTDRLEFKMKTVEGDQHQIMLTISNPSVTDRIADYTADIMDQNGKETSQIKPYFSVNLEPDKSYVISSEGKVATFVWHANKNKSQAIIISRRDQQRGGRQLVVEWTEEYGIDRETCLLSVLNLTSTPSIYGMDHRITLSLLTRSPREFDYTYYAQVFKHGGMSDKSPITLIHEDCTCPPGQFISKRCTDLKPAQCRTCTNGTFNINRDVSMACHECLPRCGSQAHVQHECNSTHNLVCECNPGFEKRDLGLQVACFPISGVKTTTSKLPILSDVEPTTSKLPVVSEVGTTQLPVIITVITLAILVLGLVIIVVKREWCMAMVSNTLKRYPRKDTVPDKPSEVMDTLL